MWLCSVKTLLDELGTDMGTVSMTFSSIAKLNSLHRSLYWYAGDILAMPYILIKSMYGAYGVFVVVVFWCVFPDGGEAKCQLAN